MPSTLSSVAIWGNGFFVPLYCITDVREMTLSALILASSAISASVIPSEKYSCSGSWEKFSSGRTAMERIGGDGRPVVGRRIPPKSKESAMARNNMRITPAPTGAHHFHLYLLTGTTEETLVLVGARSRRRSTPTSLADWERSPRSFSTHFRM